MFTAKKPSILRQSLNRFDVPMFAAQRKHHQGSFRLICVNDAYVAMTGRPRNDLEGVAIDALVPQDLADRLNAHYARCAERNDLHTHSEHTPIATSKVRWKTTLQPVAVSKSAQRVIGTCSVIEGSVIEGSVTQHTVTDAEFFATQAQLQMAQMQYFLESLEHSHDLPHETRAHAAMVNGLARSLSRVLSDMRTAAQPKPPRQTAFAANYTKPVEPFETLDQLNRCLAEG